MFLRRHGGSPQWTHGFQRMGTLLEPSDSDQDRDSYDRAPVRSIAQSHARPDHWAKTNDESEACTTINAVAQLASLDRIVIVMSVLERYSVRECAALLDCSVRDVQPARMRALLQIPVRALIVS
jgi:DNA-directed RNA polymerase specialized sigma24 family protein